MGLSFSHYLVPLNGQLIIDSGLIHYIHIVYRMNRVTWRKKGRFHQDRSRSLVFLARICFDQVCESLVTLGSFYHVSNMLILVRIRLKRVSILTILIPFLGFMCCYWIILDCEVFEAITSHYRVVSDSVLSYILRKSYFKRNWEKESKLGKLGL